MTALLRCPQPPSTPGLEFSKSNNVVTFAARPSTEAFPIPGYENEINNHISNSCVLYTWRCCARLRSAHGRDQGTANPVVFGYNGNPGQNDEFARTLGV